MAHTKQSLVVTSTFNPQLRFRPKTALRTVKLETSNASEAAEVLLPGTPLFFDTADSATKTAYGIADLNNASTGAAPANSSGTLIFQGFLWNRSVTMPANGDSVDATIMVDGTFHIADVQNAYSDGTALPWQGTEDNFFQNYLVQQELRRLGFFIEGTQDPF